MVRCIASFCGRALRRRGGIARGQVSAVLILLALCSLAPSASASPVELEVFVYRSQACVKADNGCEVLFTVVVLDQGGQPVTDRKTVTFSLPDGNAGVTLHGQYNSDNLWETYIYARSSQPWRYLRVQASVTGYDHLGSYGTGVGNATTCFSGGDYAISTIGTVRVYATTLVEVDDAGTAYTEAWCHNQQAPYQGWWLEIGPHYGQVDTRAVASAARHSTEGNVKAEVECSGSANVRYEVTWTPDEKREPSDEEYPAPPGFYFRRQASSAAYVQRYNAGNATWVGASEAGSGDLSVSVSAASAQTMEDDAVTCTDYTEAGPVTLTFYVPLYAKSTAKCYPGSQLESESAIEPTWASEGLDGCGSSHSHIVDLPEPPE